jgi:hypothetical protein
MATLTSTDPTGHPAGSAGPTDPTSRHHAHFGSHHPNGHQQQQQQYQPGLQGRIGGPKRGDVGWGQVGWGGGAGWGECHRFAIAGYTYQGIEKDSRAVLCSWHSDSDSVVLEASGKDTPKATWSKLFKEMEQEGCVDFSVNNHSCQRPQGAAGDVADAEDLSKYILGGGHALGKLVGILRTHGHSHTTSSHGHGDPGVILGSTLGPDGQSYPTPFLERLHPQNQFGFIPGPDGGFIQPPSWIRAHFFIMLEPC